MSRMQDLVQIRSAAEQVGRPIRLLPHDSLLKIVTTDTTVTILIRRPAVTQTVTQTIIKKGVQVLIQYQLVDGTWIRQELRIPDADCDPTVIQEWGKTVSPEEHRSQQTWEAACYRPGSESRLGQRDSFYRAEQGYTEDAQVRNTWSGHSVRSSNSPL